MRRSLPLAVVFGMMVLATGCNACRSWCAGHPWFSRSRPYCPPPCNPCPPAAVPAVPNTAVVPPSTSGLGPTPNVVVPPSSPAGY
jgi:hypothetical protein